MTGSISALAVAMLLFVGSHLLLSAAPARVALVRVVGERAFRAIYSTIALALLAWVAVAWGDSPVVELWAPPIGLRHLSLLIMPIACIFLVAGLTTPNPTAIGGDRPAAPKGEAGTPPNGPASSGLAPNGIVKITRHPVMWAFALWALAHLLANGDVAGLILFGGIGCLALVGARVQENRKRRTLGDRWHAFAGCTSFVPFVALLRRRVRLTPGEVGWWRIGLGLAVCALLLWLHPRLFGVNPLPM